jgi:hypothetical protein
MLSKYVTHDNRQTIRGYAYRVGVSITGSPCRGPDISERHSGRGINVKSKDGSTYEPAMFPSWENALIVARATARLEGGRGIEPLTHARKVINAA